MSRLFIFLITIYQKVISPMLGPHCRYYPTCSEYAKEALMRYGAIKGSYLAIKRVLKCNQLFPGGYDPVP